MHAKYFLFGLGYSVLVGITPLVTLIMGLENIALSHFFWDGGSTYTKLTLCTFSSLSPEVAQFFSNLFKHLTVALIVTRHRQFFIYCILIVT
jgi:hypothetical protein